MRGWVRTNNINLFGDRITPELKARIEALPLPDLVTDKDLTVWLGSRKVVVQHRARPYRRRPHHLRARREGAVHGRHAVAQDRAKSDRRLGQGMDGNRCRFRGHARLPRTSTYVPGHGDVADLKDVEDFRRIFSTCSVLVAEGRKSGLKDEALAQEVAPKLKALHPDWNISDRAAQPRFATWTRSSPGTKRRPVPVPD